MVTPARKLKPQNDNAPAPKPVQDAERRAMRISQVQHAAHPMFARWPPRKPPAAKITSVLQDAAHVAGLRSP